MAPEAFRQRSAPVGGSKPLLSLLRADAEHGGAHRAVTASPLAVVVRLHPSALTPRRGTRPATLPTSSPRAGTRAWSGPIAGRRPRHSLGREGAMRTNDTQTIWAPLAEIAMGD